MNVVAIKDTGKGDLDITVKHWWGRQRTYRGSNTVYHDLKTGARCSTSMEFALSEVDWFHRQRRKP